MTYKETVIEISWFLRHPFLFLQPNLLCWDLAELLNFPLPPFAVRWAGVMLALELASPRAEHINPAPAAQEASFVLFLAGP